MPESKRAVYRYEPDKFSAAGLHADERIVVPGAHHIDPAVWSPLIYNFRHYHGPAPEVGHGFRSETARNAAHPV